MNVIEINSPTDARLAPFRALKATNDTRWTGRFIAEGDKLVRRLLASDFGLHSLLVSRRYLHDFSQLKRQDAELLVIPDDWVEELVGFNFHRGILACAHRKPPRDPVELCQAAREKLSLVICPDVQDPENLGTIVRTASALGVDAVILGSGCCDPFSRRVLRVSMGAAFQIPIVACQDLDATLTTICQQANVELWAAVADPAATPIGQQARPTRLGLLLGSEAHGLAPHWLAHCRHRVTIPMRPGFDSLNVAVASGILIYLLTR
ncbi:MAG TPA: RNA methyltransferase [Pirellulales bacterium]|nr:RNA methyltransferase [Pirellulales bacterium]